MPKRPLIVAVAIAASFLCSCATVKEPGQGFLFRESDYAKLGLDGGRIQPWEDGMRTTGGKGSYEWWYFDAALDDGSTIVIVFYTKSMIQVNGGLQPMISIKQTAADGTILLERTIKAKPGEFSASREGCDVRIGGNRFSGDLKDYAIHIDAEGLKADLALHGTVPAWRPATGHAYFATATGKESFFAWLPAVPLGSVTGSLGVGGSARQVSGSGYHDHNWGDASLLGLIHHWYWGRARIGDWTLIASSMTATEAYGGAEADILFLSRGGEVLVLDPLSLRCSLADIGIDDRTGKPVADKVIYECASGASRYRVTFDRSRDIERAKFASLGSPLQRFAAWLIGFDGAYLRFKGDVSIERIEDGAVVETARSDSAVWELMYFGHAPKGK